MDDIDAGGFDSWYRLQHPRVLGVLVALSGDADLARDATDEAFSRAFERWDRVSVMTSPAAWTHRVALNELRRRARRRTLEQRHRWRWVERQRDADVPEPEVWAAVRALPDRQRQVLVLRYVGDLPEAEIADLVGISRGTVASTLFEARRRLADALPAHRSTDHRSTGDLAPVPTPLTLTPEVDHGRA